MLTALDLIPAGDVVADLLVDERDTAVPQVEEDMEPAVEPLLVLSFRFAGLELLDIERVTRAGEAGALSASASFSTAVREVA